MNDRHALPTPAIALPVSVIEVQTQGMGMGYFTRLIKFLFSFSLFCVLFSSLPLLSQSLKPFLMQLFSDIIDKSYMFLLCNGLMAFIAMYSGLINASSPSDHESMEYAVHNEKGSGVEFNVSEVGAAAPIAGENVTEVESPQEEEKSSMISEPENALSASDAQEEEEEEENALVIIDEDDTEELNKKCEDFIKKMKAAFCSEPLADYSFSFSFDFDNQKSLVAAN